MGCSGAGSWLSALFLGRCTALLRCGVYLCIDVTAGCLSAFVSLVVEDADVQ